MLFERIKHLMDENGVNAKKLTAELGLPGSAITDWGKERYKPSTDAIIKIAGYFGVSVDYLLNGYSKSMVETLEFLGADYSIRTIDKEDCIYRRLNASYDVEISGCHQVRHPKSIYVWNIEDGAGIAARIEEERTGIRTKEQLKTHLDELVEKYSTGAIEKLERPSQSREGSGRLSLDVFFEQEGIKDEKVKTTIKEIIDLAKKADHNAELEVSDEFLQDSSGA